MSKIVKWVYFENNNVHSSEWLLSPPPSRQGTKATTRKRQSCFHYLPTSYSHTETWNYLNPNNLTRSSNFSDKENGSNVTNYSSCGNLFESVFNTCHRYHHFTTWNYLNCQWLKLLMSATQARVLWNRRETTCNGKEGTNMTKNTVWGTHFWSREIGQHGCFSVMKVGDFRLLILKTILLLYLAASSNAGVRRVTLSLIKT